MADTSRKWIALALVGACGLGVYKLGGAALDWLSSEEIAAAEHLENQVWIDRMPADERDIIGHLVFVRSDDGRFGAVGRSSTWRHFVEIFLWRRNDDRVRVFLPQDRVRAEFKVRTWECAGEAPEPFELCLELSRGNRTAQLYSRHDWVVRPHEGAGLELRGEPDLTRILDKVADPGLLVDPGVPRETGDVDSYIDADEGWTLSSVGD